MHAKCELYVAGRRACGISDAKILAEISAGKMKTLLSGDECEAIVYWENFKEIVRRDTLGGRAPKTKRGAV